MSTRAALVDEPALFETSRWDLTELVSPSAEDPLADQLAALDRAVAAFEAHRAELSPSLGGCRLLELTRELDAVWERLAVVESFALLRFSADTQSAAALSDQGKVQQAVMNARNRLLFFEVWWQSLSDEEAAALEPDPALEPDQHFFLAELRRRRAHMLDEKSEQIIILKDTDGMEGLITLYTMLTNRMEFVFETPRGTERLNRDELMGYVYAEDAGLRAAAYRELLGAYQREAPALAQIYAHRVRDWTNEQVGLRGFSSPIGARNFGNDVPDEAVETLLGVCRDHAALFHRFFRLKARWLGLPKLARYDVYAPISGRDREIPYDPGVRMVLDVFERFHPLFSHHARRVFDERHIDSELRRGKRTGAFCATVTPKLTPWVLTNYTGRLRDVTTLAHELGHAVHSMLAAGHNLHGQRASLPLAETASVFAEMLITEHLLAEEEDVATKRYLLSSTIDSIFAAVLRQAYFVCFEIEAHRAVLEGASWEDLNRLYFANLQDQFGDSVELPGEFEAEWLSIPHLFHTPFYCYAYSFGQLLVLALYRRYQEEGESFKPTYLRLLSRGGSARPTEILQEAGVDLSDPAFWRLGFEVIAEMIAELEATFTS
ncbi:MAG TPA: M3 family oligoendopeptidase [Thermoanaerobaculia bacterium]|nr:M3 family oligoendopeptidase [Thermoanaerobaculia bacterium]